MKTTRREFMVAAASTSLLMSVSCQSLRNISHHKRANTTRFFFTTQGKTAMMNADGTGLRYLSFDVPNQATWQPCGFFSDGHRILLLSMEPRHDGPGKPFHEYYHQTPTHLWVHDLDQGSLKEVATQERLAVFYTPQLLLSDERMLVQVVRDKIGGQTYSMNLDGSDAREFTRAGEGLPYGFNLSPDKQHVAYHLASPSGYQVWTSNTEGGERTLVAACPDHLYFCPCWSPDGQWLAFQDCLYHQDPGHDWSDLCVCRPDGSEQHLLTKEQSLWFAASYGTPEYHGNGSNTPNWTHDGSILCSHKLPGARVPWAFQAQRPDTDHFNRDFKPEQAQGGTEICRIDPRSGAVTHLTHSNPPVWDFRQSESPDGKHIVFCRAETGKVPAIWMMNADGGNPRMLSRGLDDRGADHPRWVPHVR